MDDELWLRMLARQPRLVRVPEALAFQRQHLQPMTALTSSSLHTSITNFLNRIR